MESQLKKKNSDLNPYRYEKDSVLTGGALKMFHAVERCHLAQRDRVVKIIETEKERRYNACDWETLGANKRELHALFKVANKKVKERKASIHRFNEKTKESLQVQRLMQSEKEHTESEIAKYSEIKKEMEKYVKEYSELFTSYLEQVAQNCPEFNSVQDILNQYEILENCKQECVELLKKELSEASELKIKLLKLMEEKSASLKKLDNAFVLLETRQKKTAEERQWWNQVVKKVEDSIAKKSQESVTIKDACFDLYKEICNRRSKKHTISKEDTRNQLQYIEKSILFYKDVSRVAVALQQCRQEDAKTDQQFSATDFIKLVIKEIEESRKLSLAYSLATKSHTINVSKKQSVVSRSFKK